MGGENRPGIRRARTSTRLIPAWAGKTEIAEGIEIEARAHPRVGGENVVPKVKAAAAIGSSPRGRGKPHLHRGPGHPRRLIPAWAGKTRQRRGGAWPRRAHPRVGGENEETLRPRTFAGGSSPRGRGKRIPSALVPSEVGLIPAWAGKTKGRLPYAAVRQAHPRVGGENRAYRR